MTSKILSDFTCKRCEFKFEGWIDRDDRECTCPNCGDTADRQITGGNFSLPGNDVGFPTAADKWARRHRNANKANLKELGLPT
jgi:putative FmdB family regulatory protein